MTRLAAPTMSLTMRRARFGKRLARATVGVLAALAVAMVWSIGHQTAPTGHKAVEPVLTSSHAMTAEQAALAILKANAPLLPPTAPAITVPGRAPQWPADDAFHSNGGLHKP